MIIGISGHKQSGKSTLANMLQEKLGGKWEQRQFAGKLKQMVALLLGCAVEKLEDNDFKESSLGEQWNIWYLTHYKFSNDNNPEGRISHHYSSYDEAVVQREHLSKNAGLETELITERLTPRKVLQLMGTQCGRNIHPNIWVNATMADYNYLGEKKAEIITVNKFKDYPNWIISDIRFPNEAEAIKMRGGILIRLHREGLPTTDLHESETALDNYAVTNHWDAYMNNDSGLEQLEEFAELIIKSHNLR